MKEAEHKAEISRKEAELKATNNKASEEYKMKEAEHKQEILRKEAELKAMNEKASEE